MCRHRRRIHGAASQPQRALNFAHSDARGALSYASAIASAHDAVSGYMQGKVENPTYKQVCTEATGHAETVKVVFDRNRISFRRLLEAFFAMHDPTELNRQGPDVGEQYRSGIWYTNGEQKREAEKLVEELAAQKRFGGRKIVTQIEKADRFWPAEEYHQNYVAKTGRACHVKNPWSGRMNRWERWISQYRARHVQAEPKEAVPEARETDSSRADRSGQPLLAAF